MPDLSPFSAPETDIVADVSPTGTRTVVAIYDENALTQVLGHIRYRVGNGATVAFRGQAKLHSTMYPTSFRRGRSASVASRTSRDLNAYSEILCGGTCSCDRNSNRPVCRSAAWPCPDVFSAVTRKGDTGLVSGTPRAAIEPLLQHYGLATRWIDVVDNVWVALWFACHKQVTTSDGRFAHHVRRSTAQEPDGFAYISVFDLGVLAQTPVHGLYVGQHVRMADLRSAVPSIYLRPHAQHGMLFASRHPETKGAKDFLPLVAADLRIALSDALRWLGNGGMLSTYSLFPPATRDEGYRRLLEYAPGPPSRLGRYTVYGSGA